MPASSMTFTPGSTGPSDTNDPPEPGAPVVDANAGASDPPADTDDTGTAGDPAVLATWDAGYPVDVAGQGVIQPGGEFLCNAAQADTDPRVTDTRPVLTEQEA